MLLINVRFYLFGFEWFSMYLTYTNVTGASCHNFDLAVFKSTPTPLVEKRQIKNDSQLPCVYNLVHSITVHAAIKSCNLSRRPFKFIYLIRITIFF